MRQFQLHSSTTGDGLEPVLSQASEPGISANDVLIRVRAASLNYRDLLMRQGQSASSAKSGGTVPLSDGAGEIVRIGENVTRFQTGDRVAGCFFSHWIDGRFHMRYHQAALGGSADGMLTEYIALPEEGVVPIPDSLTFEEAACLPCAGVTAWYALVERGELSEGDTVLLLGTGGVSTFALQIAAAKGARVLIISSSDAKLARAKELGASETINYRSTPEWDEAVWSLTDKQGADHVVEVGGPQTLGKSMNAVAAGGHIALIGVLTGRQAPEVSLFPLIARNVRLNGIYVGHRRAFERFLEFVDETRLKPQIDRVFPFEKAPAAYDYLASGAHFGKVVVRLNEA